MDQKNFFEKSDIKIHSSVVVGTKGQFVIPKSARELLEILPWDNLMIITKWKKFMGIIKSSDIEFFSDYLNEHIKNHSEHL